MEYGPLYFYATNWHISSQLRNSADVGVIANSDKQQHVYPFFAFATEGQLCPLLPMPAATHAYTNKSNLLGYNSAIMFDTCLCMSLCRRHQSPSCSDMTDLAWYLCTWRFRGNHRY